MGKAKRCRSVVLSASVAALGATGACPAAGATPERDSAARKPATVHRHHQHHQRPSRAPVGTPRGGYVYAVYAEGQVSTQHPNTSCAGATIKLARLALFAEDANAVALWGRNPQQWERPYTVTTGPATTFTLWWTTEAENREAEENGGKIAHSANLTGTAPAANVCAATTPNAALGGVGRVTITWRLAAPARSVAALVAQPPTNIDPSEYMLAFQILPSGAVPAFSASQNQ